MCDSCVRVTWRVASIALLMGALIEPAGAIAVDVGFGEADVTPDTSRSPVWIAGYGNGRKATGVHDPILSRAVVLRDGDKKIALVSVDLIGIQHSLTTSIRKRLADFQYVLVASTHNHEGPDVIGLWGPTARESGVDPAYLERLENGVVASIRAAESRLTPAVAAFGKAEDESLVHDTRLPIVKDGILRVVRFTAPGSSKPTGLLVQFSCHPEDLDSENTEITSDFPYYTRKALEERYGCPVAYFTGAVGGLMTGPEQRFKKDDGSFYKGGDWEFARIHGEAVAELAVQALEAARPIAITPLVTVAKEVLVPLENQGYRLARAGGVLEREAFTWLGDPEKAGEAVPAGQLTGEIAMRTEVACLRLGDMQIAAIPGEIYPELVYGKYQDPVDQNVDHPVARLEEGIMDAMPGEVEMIFGLANDEIGYIIPKRQWDDKPPFAYGREKSQYGERNSVGPDVAPIIAEAFARCAAKAMAAPR